MNSDNNNIFNGINNQPQPPTPNTPPQPTPISSNQPFFGFGGENSQTSTNTIPQMPQNQGFPNPEPSTNTAPGQSNQPGIFTPTQPLTASAPQSSSKPPKTPASPEQTIKKFTVLSIILGVGAVIFLFLGIWGLVDAISTRSALAQARTQVNEYLSIVSELEKQTNSVIKTVDDLPVYQPASDYVYLTEWDVKLKIPDTLTSVSYILNQNAGYHSYVCFTGIQEGVQYYPGFADINQNRNGVGCLYRIGVTDGEKDSNGNSYGQRIVTIGDNNYFYREPSGLFSGSEAEKGLETTARDLVKQMIVDNISAYK